MLTAAALEPDSTANTELCGVPERDRCVAGCAGSAAALWGTAQQQPLEKPLLHEESQLRDSVYKAAHAVLSCGPFSRGTGMGAQGKAGQG